MGSIASISGVALVPGVSRNKRLYTPELISKAAARMQERLADPNGLPIVMRTHHEANDDSSRIVGRITAVSIGEDKSLRYKADLYDTDHGRSIAALVTPKQPALRSVSIHGYWMGDTKQVMYEGSPATTADDLEIDAIDFTASPGVDGAVIDKGSGSSKASESGGILRTPISESSEAIVLTEEATGWADISQSLKEGFTMSRGKHHEPEESGYWVQEAKYNADDMKDLMAKGHAMKNASGEPSYPIADVADLKKAIRAVGRGGKDHDAIRRHIIKRAAALKQSGLIPDNWNSDGSMKESALRLSDVKEYYPDGPMGVSGFCMDAYSGPLSVTIRGCVSPDQLRAAAQAAAVAAMNAINVLDPDDDADIDAGIEGEESEEQGTAAVGGEIPDDDMKDKYSESHKPMEVNMTLAGPVLTEATLRAAIQEEMAKLNQRIQEAAAVNGVKGKPDAEAAAVDGVDGSPEVGDSAPDMPMGAHSHVHDTSDDSASHTHGHVHTHETADGSYDHSHGHTHFHLPGSDESHMHTHMHDHSTASGDTHESTNKEESAMGDTQKAAEAAPARTLTDEDVKILGETIGSQLADAIRAIAETTAPKHAAATQETAETAVEVPAETQKADDLTALKESLAKELRKELRDELRNEFLKENGLPPRRGYRVNESSDEEVALTDQEVFDKHRVDILLGAYAATPSPDA